MIFEDTSPPVSAIHDRDASNDCGALQADNDSSHMYSSSIHTNFAGLSEVEILRETKPDELMEVNQDFLSTHLSSYAIQLAFLFFIPAITSRMDPLLRLRCWNFQNLG